jgi:uncharacterized protein YkwD
MKKKKYLPLVMSLSCLIHFGCNEVPVGGTTGSGSILSPPGSVVPGGSVTDPSGSLDAEEQQMVVLINQHRADNGLTPLQISADLDASARWLSQDMATKSYLDHTDSLGRSPDSRMTLFGFNGSTWGENIACGNDTAAATYKQWLNSPGHNANMLGPNYTLIGIARAYDSNSQYGWYWTTDFGAN